MINTIQVWLSSKKWLMTILGSVVVGLLSHFTTNQSLINLVGGLFGTYVLGQGMADFGKEANPKTNSDNVAK